MLYSNLLDKSSVLNDYVLSLYIYVYKHNFSRNEQGSQIIIAHFLLQAMASSFHKPQQNKVYMRRGGDNGGTLNISANGEDVIASSLDRLQRKFNKCLGRSCLMRGSNLIELGDPSHFAMKWKNISDNEVIIFYFLSIIKI